LFGILLTLFLAIMGLVVYTYFIQDQDSLEPGHPLETVLMLWSVVPSALLGYFIFRHNFLEIAVQRSFGYPFAAVLLLLVYWSVCATCPTSSWGSETGGSSRHDPCSASVVAAAQAVD